MRSTTVTELDHQPIRRRVGLLVSALALAGVAITVSPATAADGTTGAEAWQPVTQQPFTAPAGKYCTFAFSYRPDIQNIEGRVLSRYPDGTVKAEEFRGLLIGTTTNLDTGEHIQRDSSGRLLEEFNADGSLATFTTHGPVGFGFRAGDNYPQGYYQLGGYHQVTFDSAGIRTMAVDEGPEENICETLG